MNNKYLIEVIVPAASKSFDILIPKTGLINDMLQLISAVVNEETKGHYIASKDAVLCDYVSGSILNINIPVEESGLRNGSKLVLI